MAMLMSSAGLKALAKEEGEVLEAYQDSGGVWTVGVGHTGSEHAFPGSKISKKKSQELLKQDVKDAEEAVNRLVKVPLTQLQADSLISLVFNIGQGAFARSTLLKLLNQGDYYGAADQFLVWRKAGGRVLRGLEKRRARERAMFLSGTSCKSEDPLDSNIEPDIPSKPPVSQSKPTLALAGTGVAGTLSMAAEAVSPLSDYSEYLKILWVCLVIAGIAYFIYSRKET